MIQPVNQDLSDAFHLDHPQGALVSEVTPGSPADKAGIQSGDIITSFNGKAVGSSEQLPPVVANAEVGKPVQVTVIRKGDKKTLTVTIGQLDQANLASARDQVEVNKLDITVANLSDKQRKQADVGKLGVKVQSVGKGPAANAGIRPGDIILNIDHQDVHNTKDILSISKQLKNDKSVPILVERGKNQLFLALKLHS